MTKVHALRRFKAFHGRDAKPSEIGRIACPAVVALKVGELDGVIYTATGDRKKYIHKFKKSSRPLLFVSSDGKQAFILGGGYRFTDRGFVG